MIYKTEYFTGKDESGKNLYLLKLKFGFWKQTCSEDMDNVDSRKTIVDGRSSLSRHLFEKENLKYCGKDFPFYFFKDDFRDVKIGSYRDMFGLHLSLNISTKKKTSIKKLFDARSLDKYILTGEKD